jgi:hypothetical protein
MAQVVEPNAAIRCPFDTGDLQRVMKRPAERGDGIPISPRAGEQGCVRATVPVALCCSDAALNNALDQIRCERHHPRFVEFAVTDMQNAGLEIEIGLRKPQQFSSSQPSQVEKTQRGAKNSRSYRRPLPRRKLGTGLQETAALISAEHARQKLLSNDPQGLAIRYDHTGIVQTQEAADLPDERQAVRASRLRFGASPGDVLVYNCGSDERISCGQAGAQKTVEVAQDATFLSIAVTHCMLQGEEPREL